MQSERVVLHIDLHSYGNEFIEPYSLLSLKINEEHPFIAKFQQIFHDRSPVLVGNAMDIVGYQADGVMMDWMANQGIISFTYEGGINFKENISELERDLRTSEKALNYTLSFAEHDSFSKDYTVTRLEDEYSVVIYKYTSLVNTSLTLPTLTNGSYRLIKSQSSAQ